MLELIQSLTEHNVDSDWYILDAPLTKLGRQQARELNESTQDSLQQDVELIVSSPLRRTMSTTLDGYPKAIESLGGKGKLVLLPDAQECNDCKSGYRQPVLAMLTDTRIRLSKQYYSDPCDTGSDRSFLEKDPEYQGSETVSLLDSSKVANRRYQSTCPP